jgi:hypothetical protein
VSDQDPLVYPSSVSIDSRLGLKNGHLDNKTISFGTWNASWVHCIGLQKVSHAEILVQVSTKFVGNMAQPPPLQEEKMKYGSDLSFE